MRSSFPSTRVIIVSTLLIFCGVLFNNLSHVSAAAITSTLIENNPYMFYPSITLGTDGFARMTYYSDSVSKIKYARCPDLACTSPVTTILQPPAAGWNNHIAIGNDGFARIVYANVNTATLQFVQCTNDDCTTSNNTTVVASGARENQLVIGNDGFARIVYASNTDFQFHYIQCTNASCSTSITTILDTSNRAGFEPTMAKGSDGYMRIAYSRFTNGDLVFIQCTNDSCSSNNTSVLHTGYYQSRKSIAMGSDGFARLTYRNNTLGAFQFIRCTNADCSTNVETAFGGSIYNGSYHALLIGADTFPRIITNDSNLNELSYIQCTNQDCTGVTPLLIEYNSAQPVFALTGSDVPIFLYSTAMNSSLQYTYCSATTCTEIPVLTLTPSLSDTSPSATDVQQIFAITLGSSIPNGGKASLSFPAAFSTSFATLTDADVNVTGTNVASAIETFDTAQNKLTSTLTTTGATSDLTITVGDGAPGGLNDLSNPATNGIFGVGFSTFSSLNTLIEQGLAYLDIGGNFAVQASISEALIFTVENSNIALTADPSLNGGENTSQYTVLTGASNALNGYSVYGSLDDGTGNARLSNGSSHITSGTGENTFGFEAKNAAYASNEVVVADNSFANTPTLLTSNSTNISTTGPTNEQQHTVYYDLNVDYLTAAGTYTGTIWYTAIGSF